MTEQSQDYAIKRTDFKDLRPPQANNRLTASTKDSFGSGTASRFPHASPLFLSVNIKSRPKCKSSKVQASQPSEELFPSECESKIYNSDELSEENEEDLFYRPFLKGSKRGGVDREKEQQIECSFPFNPQAKPKKIVFKDIRNAEIKFKEYGL